MDHWKCNECEKLFADPLTYWATEMGVRLAAIDWFCPFCFSYEVAFLGEEEDAYWNQALLG